MMMRRFLTVVTAAVIAFAAAAATYSVESVPNVHLADSTRFVSNPDGILSPQAEAQANALLQKLMRETSAEVACVVVDDITDEPDDFATDLFRSWKIGKKDTNNGVLVLVAKDRRRAVIRTGTGVEGLLPDGLCGSIIRANMIPNFRANDYDTGTLGALADIAGILSEPEARAEIMSKYANNADAGDNDGEILCNLYLGICGIISLIAVIYLLGAYISVRKATRYQKSIEANKLYSTYMFASFLTLGMALVAFIPLALWRHNLRRGKHLCPTCAGRMNLIDEQRDNDFLTRAQDIEEQIGAVDYDVWQCPTDGTTEIIPYVQRASAYTVCPVCHARTMRVVSDRTTVQPTNFRTGTRVITRQCLNCGHEDDEYKTLPKVAPIIIASGGRGGSGGGGFGGGSFGGGFTAGGGASGGW